MNARSASLLASNKVESTAVAPRPRTSHGGRAGAPGQGRWKLALESRWQRKIDEVVVLSRARSGLASEPGDTVMAPPVQRSPRLGPRIDEALNDVAAIEDALARLDDGSYGICAGCDRRMRSEWLAETPETRYCPDCSLRLLSWEPQSKRKMAGAQRTDTPGAPADSLKATPQATRRAPRRAGRPTAAGRL